MKENNMSKVKSDGSTASYYELPPAARELQDLIAYKNMNAQMGEIFRACYRYGQVEHSGKLRDINKILYYAEAEKTRLLKYEAPPKPKKDAGDERLEELATYPAIADAFSSAEKLKPFCTVCNKEIDGRVFYLGNEPRCKKHSNG